MTTQSSDRCGRSVARTWTTPVGPVPTGPESRHVRTGHDGLHSTGGPGGAWIATVRADADQLLGRTAAIQRVMESGSIPERYGRIVIFTPHRTPWFRESETAAPGELWT